MNSLRELRDFIAIDRGLSNLQLQVEQSLTDDPAHDIEHSLRVAIWTCRLGGDQVDCRNSIAAALCHDIVNVPKNSPRRSSASLESAKRSQELLPVYGFGPDAIAEIAEAIKDHSYSRGAVPTTLLGCALQDADRLDALGAIGIMRNVSTAIQLGAKFFDQNDPWSEHRSLDDKSFAIDHYFTKLLQLSGTMRTVAGRAEARRRTETMMIFLNALSDELLTPWPLTSE